MLELARLLQELIDGEAPLVVTVRLGSAVLQFTGKLEIHND